MAYAIIQAGGKQFRVEEGKVVQVPYFQAEAGSTVEFEVLALGNGSDVQIGTPLLSQRAQGKVVDHGRGPKVIVFKKKRRKQYKKTHGHRQDYTAVLIESLGA